MEKVVFLDQLEPGDIILSRENSSTSWKIRLATLRKFSHAALVIDPLIWIESTSEGVGIRVQPFKLVVYQGKMRLMMDIKDRHLEVFRLKNKNNNKIFGTKEKISAKFEGQIRKKSFRPYPTYEHFTNLVPKFFRKPVKKYFKYKNKNKSKYVVGNFCSELVASIYNNLGSPLFDNLQPQSVTPGRLIKSEKLARVQTPSYVCKNTDYLPAYLLKFEEKFTNKFDILYNKIKTQNETLQKLFVQLSEHITETAITQTSDGLPGHNNKNILFGESHLEFVRKVPFVDVNLNEIFSFDHHSHIWVQFLLANRCLNKRRCSEDTNFNEEICSKIGCRYLDL